VFTKNRDRLLTTDVARKVLAAILAHREVAPLLSDEHFSVDGTLVKAWVSMKSFQPKPEAASPGGVRPDDPPPPQPPSPLAEAPAQTARHRVQVLFATHKDEIARHHALARSMEL